MCSWNSTSGELNNNLLLPLQSGRGMQTALVLGTESRRQATVPRILAVVNEPSLCLSLPIVESRVVTLPEHLWTHTPPYHDPCDAILGNPVIYFMIQSQFPLWPMIQTLQKQICKHCTVQLCLEHCLGNVYHLLHGHL